MQMQTPPRPSRPSFGIRLRRAVRRVLLAPLPRTWELRFLMWEAGRDSRRELAAARARKATGDEMDMLRSDWEMEYRTLEEEYETIFSRRLLKKAIRLRVPVPEYPVGDGVYENENWRRALYTGTWYLRTEGIRRLRAEIRAELKARSERRQALLTPLTGLVGALTGLVAIMRACTERQ